MNVHSTGSHTSSYVNDENERSFYWLTYVVVCELGKKRVPVPSPGNAVRPGTEEHPREPLLLLHPRCTVHRRARAARPLVDRAPVELEMELHAVGARAHAIGLHRRDRRAREERRAGRQDD